MKKPLFAAFGLLATLALGAGISMAETAPPAPGGKPAHAERGRGGDRTPSPERMADRCQTRFAFEAGRLAFLEARLELTPQQKPLWDAYKTASAQADAQARDACIAAIPAKAEDADKARPSLVDREAMKAKRLEQELAQLKATQPALAALYPALNADQQKVLDRPLPGHGREGGYTRTRFDRDGRDGPHGRQGHGDRERGGPAQP